MSGGKMIFIKFSNHNVGAMGAPQPFFDGLGFTCGRSDHPPWKHTRPCTAKPELSGTAHRPYLPLT